MSLRPAFDCGLKCGLSWSGFGASLLEYELFLQAYERIEPWFADVLVSSPGYGETPKPGSGKPIA